MAEKSTSKEGNQSPTADACRKQAKVQKNKDGLASSRQGWFNPDFLNPACAATSKDLKQGGTILESFANPPVRKTTSECKKLDSSLHSTPDGKNKGKRHRRHRRFKGCCSSSSWAPPSSRSNSDWPRLDDLIPRDPHRNSDSELCQKTQSTKKKSRSSQKIHLLAANLQRPEAYAPEKKISSDKPPPNKSPNDSTRSSPKSLNKDKQQKSPVKIKEPLSPLSPLSLSPSDPATKSNDIADCSSLFPSMKANSSNDRRKFGPSIRLLSTKLSQTALPTCSNQNIKIAPKLSDTKLLSFSETQKLTRQLTPFIPQDGGGTLAQILGIPEQLQNSGDFKLEGPEINPLSNSPFFDSMDSPVVLENLEIKKFNNSASPFFERKPSSSEATNPNKNPDTLPDDQAVAIQCTTKAAAGDNSDAHNTCTNQQLRVSEKTAELESPTQKLEQSEIRQMTPNPPVTNPNIAESNDDSAKPSPSEPRETTAQESRCPPQSALHTLPVENEEEIVSGDFPVENLISKATPAENLIHRVAKDTVSSTTVILSSTTILNTTVVLQNATPAAPYSGRKTVEITQLESLPSSPKTSARAIPAASKIQCHPPVSKSSDKNSLENKPPGKLIAATTTSAKLPGRRPPIMRKSNPSKRKLSNIGCKDDKRIPLVDGKESSATVQSSEPDIIFEDASISSVDLTEDSTTKNKPTWVPTSFFHKGNTNGLSCNSSSSSESQPDLISGGIILDANGCHNGNVASESSSNESCGTFIVRGIQSVSAGGNEDGGTTVDEEQSGSASSSSSSTDIHLGDTQYFIPVLTKDEQKSCIRPVRRGDSRTSVAAPHYLKAKSTSCKSIRYHGEMVTNAKMTCTTTVLTSTTRSSRRRGPRMLRLFRSPSHNALSTVDCIPNQTNNGNVMETVGSNRRKSTAGMSKSGILLLPAISTKNYQVSAGRTVTNAANADGITKFELDPILAFRIPSFELVPLQRHEDDDQDSCENTEEEVSKMNKFELDITNGQQQSWPGRDDMTDDDDDWISTFYSKYSKDVKDKIEISIPPDMSLTPATFSPSSEESVKIMKEAEFFLNEYRNPGSQSFGHRLSQFAAYYERLMEPSSTTSKELPQPTTRPPQHQQQQHQPYQPSTAPPVPAQPSVSSSTDDSGRNFCTQIGLKHSKGLKNTKRRKKNPMSHTCRLRRLARCMSFCRRNFSLRKTSLSRPFLSCCCREKFASQHYSCSLSKVKGKNSCSSSSNSMISLQRLY